MATTARKILRRDHRGLISGGKDPQQQAFKATKVMYIARKKAGQASPPLPLQAARPPERKGREGGDGALSCSKRETREGTLEQRRGE